LAKSFKALLSATFVTAFYKTSTIGEQCAIHTLLYFSSSFAVRYKLKVISTFRIKN